jgi:hypothetical protein
MQNYADFLRHAIPILHSSLDVLRNPDIDTDWDDNGYSPNRLEIIQGMIR